MDGEIPYVDRWDHKGPLIYLLNAAGLFVGGVQGIWVLASLFLIGSSLVRLQDNERNRSVPRPPSISLAIFLMHFPKFAQGGNLTEHYALLFQFSALLLFVRIEHRGSGKDIWPAVAIGMLGAGAFLLRANLIGVWLAIGTYWLLQRDHGLRWTAWSIVGGLSVLLVVSIVFALAGGVEWAMGCLHKVQLRLCGLFFERQAEGAGRYEKGHADAVPASRGQLVYRPSLLDYRQGTVQHIRTSPAARLDSWADRSSSHCRVGLPVDSLLSGYFPGRHGASCVSGEVPGGEALRRSDLTTGRAAGCVAVLRGPVRPLSPTCQTSTVTSTA